MPVKFLALLPLTLLVISCNRDPKAQAQRYLDNGNKFFSKSKYKEASIMYRRSLQKEPRFGEAYYRLALTDLKLGAYSDAARMLVRAVELMPDNTDAQVKLADLYLLASLQDKQHAEELTNDVKDIANKLLAKDPNSYDGHRLKGQMAMLEKDSPEAIRQFEAANRVNPMQPDLVLAYFQALTTNNQLAEAEKLGRQLIDAKKDYSPMYDLLYLYYVRLGRIDDGEQLLKLKTQNNPKNASFLLQLASHYYFARKRPELESVIQKLDDEKAFPEGHLLAGDFFFFRLREFDRARQEYETAEKDFPKDKALYQKRLVELFASSGKTADATQLLATILKDNPKDNDAIAMRAALMLVSGNRDQVNQAVNDLQSLVTKSPDNHLLRFNLGRALVARGDTEAARLQLEEAIKLRPDFVIARELLGRIYLAKSDPGKALQTADELIALDPNNLQGHLIRSSSLMALGDQEKARQELDLIMKVFPQNVEARYQTGLLAWQQKDYKKAESVFGDLFKSNPKDLRGLVGVVETLASQNRMGEAIQAVKKSVEAEPLRQDLKLTLANLYVRAEQYDAAIQIYQELLTLDPKSADLTFKLAETYRRKGDLNIAIDAFRKASAAAPNDPNPLLQLGLLMDGTGRRDQAKPIYEQILKLQPDQPVALNNLAYIIAEEGGDLDSALTMAQRARQRMPNYPEIADTLGLIYIKKNLSEDAARILQDLVEKQPKRALFRYHFGMALLQKGDRPTAKKELEAAMKNNPSKAEAGEIQSLLRKL